jgi:hypothetical protein
MLANWWGVLGRDDEDPSLLRMTNKLRVTKSSGATRTTAFSRLVPQVLLYHLAPNARPHLAAVYWIMAVIPCALASATRALW